MIKVANTSLNQDNDIYVRFDLTEEEVERISYLHHKKFTILHPTLSDGVLALQYKDAAPEDASKSRRAMAIWRSSAFTIALGDSLLEELGLIKTEYNARGRSWVRKRAFSVNVLFNSKNSPLFTIYNAELAQKKSQEEILINEARNVPESARMMALLEESSYLAVLGKALMDPDFSEIVSNKMRQIVAQESTGKD